MLYGSAGTASRLPGEGTVKEHGHTVEQGLMSGAINNNVGGYDLRVFKTEQEESGNAKWSNHICRHHNSVRYCGRHSANTRGSGSESGESASSTDGTQLRGERKINNCTNPTNLTWLGQQVWKDTHTVQ
jgi:hypothetical protein